MTQSKCLRFWESTGNKDLTKCKCKGKNDDKNTENKGNSTEEKTVNGLI